MKKVLALLLALLTVLPLFAACGEEKPTEDTTAPTEVSEPVTEAEDTPDVPAAEELDIAGDFNILVTGNWAWNDYESDGT